MVEGALAGQGEVGGERGVGGQPAQLQAVGGQGVDRALGVVHRLGPAGIGQPARQRPLVVLGERGRVEVGAGPVGGGQGQPVQGPGAPAPGAADRHAGPAAARRVLGQPAGHLLRPGQRDLHVERPGRLVAGVGRGGHPADSVRQRGVEAVPQDPELEGVEQLVDLLAVPLGGAQVGRPGLQRDVAGELGELPVAQHVGQVLPEVVPGPALDLVHPVHQLGQRAVLGDPFGRGLLPDPRDAGQVVARVAAQGGVVGVLDRGEAVLGGDLLRREAGHLGDAAPGHQRRGALVHQLQHVPVAGDDEHVEAGLLGLGGEGGDDVVGLVPGHRQPLDAQRVEHLEDEAELVAEVGRGLPPVRLVLDPLLMPEGRLAAVEGDGHVGGRLVAQHVDEHRGEAVDGVGGLAGGGGEVLRRQREEGPVGQGVAVQQEQPVPPLSRCCVLGRLGHHVGSLVAGADSAGEPWPPPARRRVWRAPCGVTISYRSPRM